MNFLIICCLFVASLSLHLSNAKRRHDTSITNELEALTKGDFKIYGHHELNQNELCRILRCKRNEVCLVKDENAICAKKKKLYLPKELLPVWLQKELEVHHVEAKKPRHPHHGHRTVQEKELHPNDHHKKYIKKQTKKAQHTAHVHLRDRHPSGPTVECSDKDLEAMGNRLRIWFGQIHHGEPQTVVHLAKHHISCPREVGWMFGKLDGDEDGTLTPDELGSVENDPREPCLRPFLDRCDDDGDDEIDIDEWCDCFLFSGRERDEPPCHKARHKIDPHLLGVYLPRCDVDGFYRPIQCHEAECWCVDKLGREFDSSRVLHQRPDCGQYEEKDDSLEDLDFEIPKYKKEM